MKAFLLALPSMMALTFLSPGAVSASGVVQPVVIDVALNQRGAMAGQVVDAQGIGVPGQPVLLLQGNRELARATSDAQGYFAVEGVGGGIYQLVASDSSLVVRVWAPGTEPPVAQRSVLVVTGNEVYRGQKAVRSVRNFFAHPVTVGAVVATAIALPIALHSPRRRAPDSP